MTAPMRPKVVEAAAMSGARSSRACRCRRSFRTCRRREARFSRRRDLAKSFGGIRRSTTRVVDRVVGTLHALIGPNGSGKTTVFNLVSGLFAPDRGTVVLAGKPLAGLPSHAIANAGLGRSFQITNLFAGVSVYENVRLAVQARDAAHFSAWSDARANDRVTARTKELVRFLLGLSGMEHAEAGTLSYGGQRLLDMGLALGGAPRVLLLDEPLAGLAAAERERVGALIKRLSADLPVLLVEHDIDRVFALADRVTVMNDGLVLLDGTAADARDSAAVREVYIGSGTAALAATARGDASAGARPRLLSLDRVDAFYGKSHIVKEASLPSALEQEIVALLGRNGAGKSTLLKTILGIVPAAAGSILRATSSSRAGRRPPTRSGIGYVPQGRGLFAGMSVRHNLELGRLKRREGTGVAWSEEKILEVLPQAARSPRYPCGLPVGRRAADGRRRPRAVRSRARAPARRAVRRACADRHRGVVRSVRSPAPRAVGRHRRA